MFSARPSAPATPRPPGLFLSLRQFGSVVLSMLHTRVDLATVEIGEQARQVLTLALIVAGAVVCLASACFFLMVFLIIVFWAHKVLVVGLILLFYLFVAIILGATARRMVEQWPAFLGQTLTELRKDAELLHRQRYPGEEEKK
jgi:uncharacterized membrane protein YqjE